jgi:hypothetical protein
MTEQKAARIAALRASRSANTATGTATKVDRPRRRHAAAKSRVFTALASTVATITIVGGVAAGTNARAHLIGYASAPASQSNSSTSSRSAKPSAAPAPPATTAAQTNTTTSGS